MPSQSTPAIRKRHPIHRLRPNTVTRLPPRKSQAVNKTFLQVLRKIAHPPQPSPTNQLISFLNLCRPREEPSMNYIPSIENMMSQQQLEEEGQSKSSIERGFSDQIITENNCEMRVLYLCILQKILRRMQYTPSVSQRRKIIRGAWNILAKYCKDMNYQIFANIGSNVEWGLLELINFDFNVSPREKFRAEGLLLDQQTRSETSLLY